MKKYISPDKSGMKAGFSLIELSIVLVIIGLIVGGILTGQELIRAAGIRATLSQVEKFNTATRTFQGKFGALPGDILSTQAQAFGLYYVTTANGNSNALAYGNGDGIIQGYYSGAYITGGTFGGEIAMFFLHLSQAGLINGMYGAGGADVIIIGATTTGGSSGTLPQVSVTTPSGTIGEILPPAKLGNGNYFTVASTSGQNYYVLSGITQINTGLSITSTNNLTPLDAYAMDKKIDDGLPASGKVFALDTTAYAISYASAQGITTPAANNCVNGTAYYTTSTFGNTQNCSLRFDFQ